ncbi:MAG: hypothetical protein QXJ62_06915 [Nitrososphaeria archaeon]
MPSGSLKTLEDYLEDTVLNSLPNALAKLKENPLVSEPEAKNVVGKLCELKTLLALHTILPEIMPEEGTLYIEYNSQYNRRKWRLREKPNDEGADIQITSKNVLIEVEVKHRLSGYTTEKEFTEKIVTKYHPSAKKILVLYTGYTEQEKENIKRLCNRHDITLILDNPIQYTKHEKGYMFNAIEAGKHAANTATVATKLSYHLKKHLTTATTKQPPPSSSSYIIHSNLFNTMDYNKTDYSRACYNSSVDHIMFDCIMFDDMMLCSGIMSCSSIMSYAGIMLSTILWDTLSPDGIMYYAGIRLYGAKMLVERGPAEADTAKKFGIIQYYSIPAGKCILGKKERSGNRKRLREVHPTQRVRKTVEDCGTGALHSLRKKTLEETVPRDSLLQRRQADKLTEHHLLFRRRKRWRKKGVKDVRR